MKHSSNIEIECKNDDFQERKGQKKPVTQTKSEDDGQVVGWYSRLLFMAIKTVSWGFSKNTLFIYMRINKQEM